MSATRTSTTTGTPATGRGLREVARSWIALVAVAAVGVGWACEPRQEGTMQEEPADTAPAAAEEERDTMAGEAPLEPEEQQEQRRTAEEAALTVETVEGTAYVTDGSGQALYVLEGGDDPSACADACTEEWPPFEVTSGEPRALGDQLQEDLIGSVERPDGTMQVTYDGQPLYFYHDDRGPGDVEGQAVEDQWGTWYLLGPDGQPIQQPVGGGGAG